MFIEVIDKFICSYGDVSNSQDQFLGEFEIDKNYNIILYDSLEEGNEELEVFLQNMLVEAMNYIRTNYNI